MLIHEPLLLLQNCVPSILSKGPAKAQEEGQSDEETKLVRFVRVLDLSPVPAIIVDRIKETAEDETRSEGEVRGSSLRKPFEVGNPWVNQALLLFGGHAKLRPNVGVHLR